MTIKCNSTEDTDLKVKANWIQLLTTVLPYGGLNGKYGVNPNNSKTHVIESTSSCLAQTCM